MRASSFAFTATLFIGSMCESASSHPPDNKQPLPSALTVTSIQQTLSLFSIAIDTKQFQLLGSVFTPTATTNFTGKSVQSGLPAITSYLQSGLQAAVSQHSLNTLHITQTDPNSAHAINYLQGTFFGQGNLTGQILSNYGYYEDDLVKSDHGGWLVQNRVLHNFGEYGNASIIAALLQ